MYSNEDIIVGGQAVIEGVMMRSPNSYAVAVRRASGEIVYKGERLEKLTRKYPILRFPILRGSAVLIQSMALGIKALNFSAGVALEDEESARQAKPSGAILSRENKAARKQMNKTSTTAAAGSLLFAIVFNVALFIVLPLLLTNIIFRYIGAEPAETQSSSGPWYMAVLEWFRIYLKPVTPGVSFNLVDGLIRVALFLGMIFSFSFLKDIKRVFQYHGAEHKVVYTYEAGESLTVENARIKPRQHPRCGTSFLMVVMLVSILMFSIVRFDSLYLNFLARILLIPLIAGLSYEVIRLSARRRAQRFFRLLTLPGIWLQNITTQEPSDDQLEVAIFALEKSLALEPLPENELIPVS